MSSHPFALVMVYLSRSLNRLKKNKKFGFHPKCKRTKIVGLLFADDLLVFYKANLNSVGLIKRKLEEFSKMSGMFANIEKSKVYIAEVDDQT